MKKIVTILMCLMLTFTTVACGEGTTQNTQNSTNFANNTPSRPPLPTGKYPVQQATYNDVDGEYSLVLLNANPPIYRTAELQMARLTDEQIQAGEKSYLEKDGSNTVMYLTEDFKIEYVHNVTETRTNPQTGQPETIVVRQQSSFWTPFAGALAGQALGNLLFRPQYYVPPIYQSNGIMTGYGGYGSSYSQAVNQYQTRYQSPPPAVQNRQTFRSSGTINKNSSNAQTSKTNKTSSKSSKSTGSGVGTNTLKNSGNSTSIRKKSSSSFGSGSGSRRTSSFGSRRRR
jgi:hypothetical protein